MAFRIVFAAFLAAVEAARYGDNRDAVRLDPPQVEASFPAPNMTLLSPAFLQTNSVPAGFSNGTEGPTPQAVLEQYVQDLAGRNPWMHYMPADYTSEEGRMFPYVYLSTQSGNATSASYSQKVRIWIQGGVHGNEPAGDQAVLALLGKMDANQTWTASVLDKADIMVLPRYNPDGVNYFQRVLASGFDPNRDHIKLARQQTRDIKQTFSAFAPHVAVDMHEFKASARYGGLYNPGVDAMIAAAKNLNIDASIREMSEKLFVPAIGATLESRGLRWGPYATAKESFNTSSRIVYEEADSYPRIGRNAMGLSQCIAYLFECRGLGIADQEFARRTYTGLSLLEGTIQTAVDNAEDVIRTVESGIQTFINSNDPIVVMDTTKKSQRNFTMVEYESGKIVQVETDFYSTTPTTANRTATRPEAYIIPRAWADLVTRLRISGVEVETLPDTFSGTAEAYNITASVLGRSYFEGVVRAYVTAEPKNVTVELPAGSFRVSTRQKNAALAMVALEPEGPDSYVTFGIVPVEVGDEYPIYRAFS
ncbi:unnamed protein product [Zymoseptoria tritici ST99CH_3D1]|nr:unnamed protein product [Zymoseptoria tritici ST99CH_3D1]